MTVDHCQLSVVHFTQWQVLLTCDVDCVWMNNDVVPVEYVHTANGREKFT